MGAQGDFERRAQELQIVKQSVDPVTDEEVVNSYLNSVLPGGVLREYHQLSTLLINPIDTCL